MPHAKSKQSSILLARNDCCDSLELQQKMFVCFPMLSHAFPLYYLYISILQVGVLLVLLALFYAVDTNGQMDKWTIGALEQTLFPVPK